MRHPRVTIFAGALAALALMSLLSAMLGTIVPTLLPKRWTTGAAAVLFFVFGAKMLQEGLEMTGGREKIEEEMREVQKEVEMAEEEIGATGGGKGGQLPFATSDLEEGRLSSNGGDGAIKGDEPVTTASSAQRKRRNSLTAAGALNGIRDGAKNLAGLFFSPIFIQAFVLTFLAEWGDRSQITTIALAAAHVRSISDAGLGRQLTCCMSR